MPYDVRPLDLADPARAQAELARVGADPAGVAKMRDKAGFLALKATGLKSAAANILKQEMLSVGGDAAVGRWVINCSQERSDVVILGTRKQHRALVRKLRPQPFGLRSLAAEIEAVLAGAAREHELAWRGGVLRLWARPHVMAALNVTPDSFSDGGDYLTPGAALDRALAMVAEGADIVDVGGESTRPGSEGISAEEELRRVLPVIEHLAPRVPVPISVDTLKAAVARAAASAGASIVNDVSGLEGDPGMATAVAETGCNLVVMHMRGTPRTMQAQTQYGDLVGEVFRGLRERVERAVAAGIARERVIVDPGIGFGKDAAGNLTLLRRLAEFRALGCPVLVGASRKSFIGKVLGIDRPKDRLEGSLAAAVLAVSHGAHIVRVHDVASTRRAVDLAWAVLRAEG
ncbi:MAG: dihydropteroate synthase [Thermodesulfobacteriota bacterium]